MTEKGGDEKFGTLFESVPDAMVIGDPSGRIVALNTMAEEMFGYARVELVGKSITELVSGDPEVVPSLGAADTSTQRSSRWFGRDQSLFGVRKNGGQFPVSVFPSALTVAGERFISAAFRVVGNEDVGDSESPGTGDQKDFRRMKSRFISTVSHELRTPLNAIIGLTEIMIEEADEIGLTQALEPLQRVYRAASNLHRLVNDILDLAIIESGDIALEIETFDISGLLDEIMTTVRPLAAKRGNRLSLREVGEVGCMDSALARVRQILVSLISNAC